MKHLNTILIVFSALLLVNCTVESTADEDQLGLDGNSALVGQWFMTAIGNTDVSNLECYRDSYLRATATELTFFIQDRQEDGSCVTLLNETVSYTEDGGFYYIEDEAIEFYIEGRTLTWRVDFETTIVFEKNG